MIQAGSALWDSI